MWPNLKAAILRPAQANRDRSMSTIVTMKCNLGHTWILPVSNTSHVVMPDRCLKCRKSTNTTIVAVVEFEDNGSPSIMIDKK